MSNFLRRFKKKCGGCGKVLPRNSTTIEYNYTHNGQFRLGHMYVCDECAKVMEAIHAIGVGSDRVDPDDED